MTRLTLNALAGKLHLFFHRKPKREMVGTHGIFFFGFRGDNKSYKGKGKGNGLIIKPSTSSYPSNVPTS